MILLCNGCSRSEVAVTPKNWKSPKASIKRKWRIYYRFYDPEYRDDPKFKKGKMVALRGMNTVYTLDERQALTENLIGQEIDLLDNQGYNPITGSMKQHDAFDTGEFSVLPETQFTKALSEALKELPGDKDTKANGKSVVKFATKAAIIMNYHSIPICDIRRRHIIKLLDQCGVIKKKWSARNYNLYRSILMMLFKVLIAYEAIDTNPVNEIPKKKQVKNIRDTLSQEQRKKINEKLRANHYPYWLFVNIFFHSGCRLRELFRITGQKVDLSKQRFKCVIKKGSVVREVWRPVKDVALQYWIEVMKDCGPDDYIFGRGFRPGKQMKSERATRLWHEIVKNDMGIYIDLYSLKHLNLDEVAKVLSIEHAQRMAEHTTPVITMDVYATGESDRQLERIKKVNNPL